MSKRLELNFGSVRRLVIESDQLKNKRIKELYKAYNDIKRGHNLLVRYPLLDVPVLDGDGNPTGETKKEDAQEWRIRVLTVEAEKSAKLPDESEEAYDARLIAQALVDHVSTVAFELLNAICKIFNLAEITQEVFDEAAWEDTRNFCFDLLSMGAISDPDGLFHPPRRADEIS